MGDPVFCSIVELVSIFILWVHATGMVGNVVVGVVAVVVVVTLMQSPASTLAGLSV